MYIENELSEVLFTQFYNAMSSCRQSFVELDSADREYAAQFMASGLCGRCVAPLLILTVAFVALMLLLREKMLLNILVSVLYVAAVFLQIYRFSRLSGEESA